ncbi:MAG: hypothetical protein ACREIE_00550 [Nitrospiraceae bacterium]
MTRPSCSLGAAVLLLLLSSDGLAQTGQTNKDPVEMVTKYLSLDRHGARLEAMSFETLKPYINWKEEPAWEHVVVITDFEVLDDIAQWEIINVLDVVIPVRFRVLGSMYWETAAFLPGAKVEEIRFRVKGVVGRWRIMEPILPPHVGQKRLIGFVRQAILDEKNPARQAKLGELLAALKKAK